MGWPQLQQEMNNELPDLVHGGPLPKQCPWTTEHNPMRSVQKMDSEVLVSIAVDIDSLLSQKCFIDFDAADSLKGGCKVWSDA